MAARGGASKLMVTPLPTLAGASFADIRTKKDGALSPHMHHWLDESVNGVKTGLFLPHPKGFKSLLSGFNCSWKRHGLDQFAKRQHGLLASI